MAEFSHLNKVVPKISATLPLRPKHGLEKDHKGLVRFTSSSDRDYITVSECLKSIIRSSHSNRLQPSTSQKRIKHLEKSLSSSLVSVNTTSVDAEPRKSAMKLPFSLPIQRSFNFVGREAQLLQIHGCLCAPTNDQDTLTGEKSRVVVLHGLGGAGKTQLSAAYSFKHQGEFDVVLWVDGTDQTNTYLSFQHIACRLLDGFSGSDGDVVIHSPLTSKLQSIKDQLSSSGKTSSAADGLLPKLAQVVIDVLQSTTETFTWLLIFDNVDNLTDYPLPTFLPQSKRGRIIITTRLTSVTRFGHPVEVGQIEAGNAVKILLNNASLRTVTDSGECPQRTCRYNGHDHHGS
jgi:hypothetical protein